MSLLYSGEADSSLYNIETVSLVYVEEAGFFSVPRKGCVPSLCRGGRLFFIQHRRVPSICRGGRRLLYTDERVSLFYKKRRQTPSLCRRESFHTEETASFSIYRKESVSLPDTEETDSSIYRI